MNGRGLIVALVLLACGAVNASAQIYKTVFDDVKYGVVDLLSIWASPFQGSASDYGTAALAAGAVGVTAVFDRDIGRWIREHPGSVALDVLKPFRERDSKPKLVDLGAGESLDQIGVGLWLIGLIAGSRDLRDAGIGCIVSEKANGIPRHYIYKGVSRERPLYLKVVDGDTVDGPRLGDPYDINFPGDENWYDNSFFGGHGANVMSCASFMNHRFHLGLAEPVIWTVAVGINIGRMADQRHWASDMMVGALVGYSIGKYLAERQLDRIEDEERTGSTDSTRTGSGSPLEVVLDGLYLGGRQGAMVLGWRRTF